MRERNVFQALLTWAGWGWGWGHVLPEACIFSLLLLFFVICRKINYLCKDSKEETSIPWRTFRKQLQTLNSSNIVQDREAPVKVFQNTLSSLFQTPKDWKITEGKKLQSFIKIIFYSNTSSPDRTWTRIDISLLFFPTLCSLNSTKRLRTPMHQGQRHCVHWPLSSLESE